MGSTNFNTQPPEGGWSGFDSTLSGIVDFNTQPPEGGWKSNSATPISDIPISTHSRPKAAGRPAVQGLAGVPISTHSRPKAAGTALDAAYALAPFQHTAARRRLAFAEVSGGLLGVYFNTQPPEGGWTMLRAG